MESQQPVPQPESSFPVETKTKNLTREETNLARAKAAMQAFIYRNKEVAAAGDTEGSSSSKPNEEENEIELNLEDLKVN